MEFRKKKGKSNSLERVRGGEQERCRHAPKRERTLGPLD